VEGVAERGEDAYSLGGKLMGLLFYISMLNF
jgi:hypothetical protein